MVFSAIVHQGGTVVKSVAMAVVLVALAVKVLPIPPVSLAGADIDPYFRRPGETADLNGKASRNAKTAKAI